MRISKLINAIRPVPAAADREISRLILDSRQIQKGDAFVAIKGSHADGRNYIANAIKSGAAVILVDAETAQDPIYTEQDVPCIPIFQLQQKLGEIAAHFYDYPARQLRMIGVTGTNGKTSCTHFIAQMLQSLGIPCGILGTLGNGFFGRLGEPGLTTPDAITLQATLQAMVAQGAKAMAMEVSSHSIDQGRVNGIEYEVGVFTNLTQDHLDYHGDMATYAAVKKRFLAELPTRSVVLNLDDHYGRAWASELAAKKAVYGYSVVGLSSLQSAARDFSIKGVYVEQVELALAGITARVHSPWGEGVLKIPLIGKFNLSNALAVLTTLCVFGVPFSEVLQRLSQLQPVAGRMQTLGGQGKPLVVVDYSHTPDSLQNALQALRAHTQEKLICVFGCGGDRDQGKRPLMAKIAEQLADAVIVTNDNPRHEKPEAIASQIIQGFSNPERVMIELNRSKAIQNSIQLATARDCILIAGKGAERYQQMGDEKLPFDDVEQVKAYLKG